MDKKNAEELKFFLKGRCSNCSSANAEIVIESKTFKKTKKGYECNSDDYESTYNKIDPFDENGFEIFALGHTLMIPYEKLDYWMPDDWKPGKIHLYLKNDVAVVLYEHEKLELANITG